MLQTTDTRFEKVARLAVHTHQARGATEGIRNVVQTAFVGGIFGGIFGYVVGTLLLSVASLAAFGMALPVLLALFASGIGILGGSFIDLLDLTNGWRKTTTRRERV
jgi:hypothetical protein